MRNVPGLAAMAILFLGCGGGDGSGDPDAPVIPMIDAMDPPDPDAAPPSDAAPALNSYVLSAANVPTSNAEAQMYGLDIDGDQPGGDPTVDNQLGSVIAALGSFGFDTQASVDDSIDQGFSITLLRLTTTAAFETYIGENPVPPACNGAGDTICRRHLDGNGAFDVVAAAPTGTMPYTETGGITTGGPGTAVISLTLFGQSVPIYLELIGARFTGMASQFGVTSAKLAGAVTQDHLNTTVIPALAVNLESILAVDCPGPMPPNCNCAPGSNGAQLIQLFDADADCAITALEIQNNALVMSLLAPDVTINGTDAISFGIGFEAVPATYMP
jgi:hypothetical protein